MPMLRRLLPLLLLAIAVAPAWAGSSPEFRLANGLRVALRPIPGAQQAALVVLFSIGNDHDPEGRSGLAHLVEHVYVTAAAGSVKARTAEEMMTRGGGNAQTGEDQTLVAESFAPGELNARLAEAAARMRDLRVQPSDLEREKPRLIAEVSNMFGGIPSLGAWNLAYERVRPSPAGARRGGVPAQVSAITVDQVRERWRRYYKPRNAVLVLAGGFDVTQARAAIEKEFRTVPSGDPVPAPRPHPRPVTGGIHETGVESLQPGGKAAFSIMYAAPRFSSPEFAPFLVLISRLVQQMPKFGEAGEMGGFPPPVYYAPVDSPQVVAFSGRLRPGETAEAAACRIQRILDAALRPALRRDEIAATRMNPGAFLGMGDLKDAFWSQNPYGLALVTAYRMRTGLDPARLDQALDRVTDADLRQCAAKVFSRKQRAVVIARPK